MNILLIGSGGREHAFALKLTQSPLCKKLYVSPGNSGTAQVAENVQINNSDFDQLARFCLDQQIEMLVIGPEEPLVAGLSDYFKANSALKHIRFIGPVKNGALLEGSKDFAKAFMRKYNIPTARYASFVKDNIDQAYTFLELMPSPYVLKADGLAAGKGVLIIDDLQQAKEEVNNILLNDKFGTAGSKVVIEEFLPGIEMSVFALCDGKNYVILPSAKDYKRIGEHDTGLNTGGMGAVSPVPFADASFMKKVEERIIEPTVKGLNNENIPYCGFIFIGLMKVGDNPYVIEYNVRMGDPETEVVLPRIKSDLVDLFVHTADQKLNQFEIEIDDRYAVTVVAVSEGYPGPYQKGKVISGLKDVTQSTVYHAGTIANENNVLTNGGRVMAITSLDQQLSEALAKSYSSLNKVCYEGIRFRKDIGKDLLPFLEDTAVKR